MAGATQWRLLARLREAATKPPVVALIDTGSAQDGVRAVYAGARSVLPRSVAAEPLRRTVAATMEGQAVLPAAVAELLAGGGSAGDGTTVAPGRIDWLRKLASGVTVAQLAAQAGYSERAMFRLLTGVYQEMGARNRIEAIMLARDRGWI